MRTIIISKTQIDRHRHSQLKGLSHKIIYCLDKLGRSRKRVFSGNTKLYCNDAAFISYASVFSGRCPSVSCCNPENGCAMPAYVPDGNKAPPFRFRKRQRLVNFLFCIFTSCCISLGGISRNGLIPQFQNPCCPVLVSKIRVKIVNSRICGSHKDSFAAQPFPASLHRRNTACPFSLSCGKIKPFRFFHKFHLRPSGKSVNLCFRNRYNGITAKEGHNGNPFSRKPLLWSAVFYNNFPETCFRLITYIQIPGFFTLPWRSVHCKIQ